MGFAGASVSFSRFRILDPVPEEIFYLAKEKLTQSAFQDIDNVPQHMSYGWVSLDDMLDNRWQDAPPQKGEYIVFSLRIDTRRIPPAVIKKHLDLALREERARTREAGKKFIARERIKEIKEQLILKLNQRFLPVPAEFNVIWNLRKNEIWFASIQNKIIELFRESFLATFNLHIEQLTPYNLACSILEEVEMEKLDGLEATVFACAETAG